jgi:hypothetical protein
VGQDFDPQDFLAKLRQGKFDGRVKEGVAKLTHEQLAEVATLMCEVLRRTRWKDSD